MLRCLTMVLLAAAAFAQTTPTTITDTVRIPVNGGLLTGRAVIRASRNMTCGLNSYVPVPVTVTVTSGVFSATLIPNSQCSPKTASGDPATWYQVEWSENATGRTWTDVLVVPASASPIPLALARGAAAAAGITVALTQIGSGGAAAGQSPVWNGEEWEPGTAAVAWGGVTGTLSNQADLVAALAAKQNALGYMPENPANKGVALGYAGLDGSTKVPIGQLPTGQTSSTVAVGNDARFYDARTPLSHAPVHQHGGADEVGTATPAANAIPKAGSGGTLAAAWIPTLNQNTTGTAAGLSATLALASGGTNNTTYTPGRCVQVSADGTKMESAADACGVGTAASPYVVTFTSETSKVVTAATHGLGMNPLLGGCFDGSGVSVGVGGYSKDGSGQATITMAPAWTGTCVLHAGSGYTGGGGGDVSSVFGRTGAVVAAANDYAFSQISGTVAVSQGGTGATTAAAARVALLPSLTGNAAKILTVNSGATDAEWVTGGAWAPLTVSVSLSSWGSIAAGGQACKSMTLLGVVGGDAVIPRLPSTLEAGLWPRFKPLADGIEVCLDNRTASPITPADGQTFGADVPR